MMAPTRRGTPSTVTPLCGDQRRRSSIHVTVVTAPLAPLAMASEPSRLTSPDAGSSAAAIPVAALHACSTPE